MEFYVGVATENHCKFAEDICQMMEEAAKVRGTGIAKRQPVYIRKKIIEGKAVIATNQNQVIGFSYIESWEGQKYVAHSGLIVHPDYRKTGLAKKIKQTIFDLSRQKFPDSKIFGITTSMAVMKINSELGYRPVTFSELTKDQTFWDGCKSCTNYDILQRTNQTMCLCTGMVCDKTQTTPPKINTTKSWENFTRFLKHRKLRLQRKAQQFPFIQKRYHNEK